MTSGEEENPKQEDQWLRLEIYHKSDQPFYALVIDADKDSVTIDIGGIQRKITPWHYYFMWAPAQEIDPTKDKREQLLASTIKHIKGQNIQIKVTEIDRKRQHVIFSPV